MVATSNGFEIAERDLKLRGPGEFFGTRQHGDAAFSFAQPLRDHELLELARREAFALAENPARADEVVARLESLSPAWQQALSAGIGGIAWTDMRVIAGKYRSRRLKGPGKLRLRPTSDRLRETLFNVLGPAIEDSLFVDLYAGTGAVGIEAISRGAREAILRRIRTRQAARLHPRQSRIARNSQPASEVIEADAVRGLEKLAARRLIADFIFLDPPYEDAGQYFKVLEFLDASHLIAPRGIVIVEHYCSVELPARFDRLERTRQLGQGDTLLSFYRLAAAA